MYKIEENLWAFNTRDIMRASSCDHCTKLAIARELKLPGVAELVAPYRLEGKTLAMIYGDRFESEIEAELRDAPMDERYRRAQMRYMGTGATGVSSDNNTVPSAHFTFSTMVIPAGGIGPSHIHYDVEEVFFVLRGKMKIVIEKDGQRWESILHERDLISVPPGVYREEVNITDEDALMCVMLGTPKPITPTYPPEHPRSKIKR